MAKGLTAGANIRAFDLLAGTWQKPSFWRAPPRSSPAVRPMQRLQQIFACPFPIGKRIDPSKYYCSPASTVLPDQCPVGQCGYR